MKKLTTLLLTFALVFTMSVPAFAAGEPVLPDNLPGTIDQVENPDITNTYTLNVIEEQGYEFVLTDENATATTRDASITVEGVNGKNYTAAVTNTKAACKLRLYLNAGSYTVKLSDKNAGLGGNQFKFTYKTETANGAAENYNDLDSNYSDDNGVDCTLYPFDNMEAMATYEFAPSASGNYEIIVKPSEAFATEAGDDNDITITIMRIVKGIPRIEDKENDIMELISGEGGTILKNFSSGEKYYIQIAENYIGGLDGTYTRHLAIKQHKDHIKKAMIDGNHVTVGCICMDPECTDCDYWLKADKNGDIIISMGNTVYNGGNIVKPVPKFTILDWTSKDGLKPTINPENYDVTVTSKNKTDIGTAKATVTFKGDYADLGKYKVSFKIVPAATTLKSVKPGKKALTIKWDKQTKKTSGYQVQYSTSSKFKSAKTVTITKNKTTSKKISKLKAKKNYYVRVRTYKTVSKTKYYSAWSNVINAKTK
ncbi:MAG: fibronectin type III domain-containing protein [Clostridiales bacterium]|nr:fibronectin type III domain-containing protein [Candidatus Crickella equi]